ncbi:MAG: RNA pseudouridine synthase, partial [Muribaculaceae bacterium]|nr:RNA pseudouridine synthase [Muribaculaceae bacterium]
MPQKKQSRPTRNRFKPDMILSFDVADQQTLMDFLCQAMPDRKRSSIKQLLKFGSVMVNGTVTSQFNTPLNQGDTVNVNLTRAFPVFYNRRVKIVYEDDDIIVIE